MADRNPLHQPESEQGRLVPFNHVSRPPLLPFEKQLIDTLGCTEDEYRRFTEEALWRSRYRPAAYDHIPDIRNDPTGGVLTSILISLAVGIATSAISYLLAPKPRSNATTNRSLGDQTGANRFAPTFGFDSQAELASYGDPIPIVFGRYTGTTGGVLVSPKLVWSRMFSYGTQQAVKLLFVVGEQGLDAGQVPQGILPPALSGVFLGNGPLDAVYDNAFAFYWKRNTTVSGFSRIKALNLVYGTRGAPESGDPETNDDIFSCPTIRSLNDTGFSSAHSLNNNNQFGCYGPIANGTAYRVNWRVISIIEDPGNNLYLERLKIAGDENGLLDTPKKVKNAGMPGVGRNYSRRMGITALNGVSASAGTEERRVNVGDTIEFRISAAQMPQDFYKTKKATVRIDDINSTLNEERINADDALQIGELFMIGRTIWQVTRRSLSQWTPEGNQDQVISLKCIDINSPASNLVGLVSQQMLTANYLSDDLGASNGLHAGAAYYPLLRFSKGMVRNTRACEVTEIGLKSRVYQRLNGLCNFQSIPTPQELVDTQEDRVNITSGVSTLFIRRASIFTIFLRPSGLDPSGQPFEWRPLGMRFAVVGNQPIDVYNYIRLQHPQRGQYEFQFIPKNGTDMRNSPDDALFWQINGAASVNNSNERSVLSQDFDTDYGRFVVSSVGKVVTKRDLQFNPEFSSVPATSGNVTTRSYPSAVGIDSYLPDVQGSTVNVTAVSFIDWFSNPTGFSEGRSGSFTTEVFGLADNSPVPDGGFTATRVREQLPNSQWVELEYRAQKVRLPAGHFSGRTFGWFVAEYNVIASSGNFNTGQEFVVSRNISPSNPFRNVPGVGTILSAGPRLRVAAVNQNTLPQGRSQGAYEEIFGPARNQDFGFSRSVVVQNTAPHPVYTFLGIKDIELTLTSFVYFEPNHWTGQTKFWSTPTITVSRNSNTSTEWKVGDRLSLTYPVSSSNPFAQQYQSVGLRLIIQGVSDQETLASAYAATRTFEAQSQYADLSIYGNLVEKSNANNPEHTIAYVNEIVSNATLPTYEGMTICGLSLKASRNFTSLDQLRLWLENGIPVRRFHPDDAATPYGPSNLFCDLVFHLLTNRESGLGSLLNMTYQNAPLIDIPALESTARFLRTNKLFYDGVLGEAVNTRSFIGDNAPFFLCNFVISDGKFGLVPAVPTTGAGSISTNPVRIKQLFTSGNILEDSFEVSYLEAEERRDFQAVVRFRQEIKNQLPQERNIVIRWNDSSDSVPVESFDLTRFCTSIDHARLVGKFMLSVRRRITHTVRFNTTPYGMDLAPGDYIKVVTESSPYSAARNGTVDASGNITSATSIADGQYEILYYKTGSEDVQRGVLQVSNNKATDTGLFNIIFTLIDSTISENIYMIEQLTLSEESTVSIVASEFPCDANLSSVLARDLLNDSNFIFES